MIEFNEQNAIKDFFEIIPEEVLKKIIDEFYIKDSFIHGTPHWSRVFYYGHLLSELNDYDKENIAFFSIFHDSKRLNDHEDPEHGLRGAEFFKTFDKIIKIKPEQKEIIYEACKVHNYLKQSDSLEVGLCLDSDRLDLWRVGVNPHDDYLHINHSKTDRIKNFTYNFLCDNQNQTTLSDQIIATVYGLNLNQHKNLTLLQKIKGVR
jgi:uncharacterized protein